MSPIFKCLICRKDIERSKKTFWNNKGYLLCSTCLDNIDKKPPKAFWNKNLLLDYYESKELNGQDFDQANKFKYLRKIFY